MTQERGFSLVESLVAVALLAVLAGLALPALQELHERNRVVASANLLLTHIQLARLRAVLDASDVVICPSADGALCAHDAKAWSQGWLVFRDQDYSQPPQFNPDSDNLLLAHRNGPGGAQVRGTPAYIRYYPSGYATNRTLTLCTTAAPQHARAIIISVVGRARVARIGDESLKDCISGI
ncbi:MAG TPA: GspH/FimT family pseudopilin [Nevskiales bacterium]|nr:GspH/FimT family pseudopilin [Nevskiales bacterium]